MGLSHISDVYDECLLDLSDVCWNKKWRGKMMKFQESRPIFMQIVDYIGEKIISGELKAGEPIPSVREMAVNMAVNPNTVVRAYERMTLTEIIINKRGVGYFVAPTALRKIKAQRKSAFYEELLPQIKREIKLLEISREDIEKELFE